MSATQSTHEHNARWEPLRAVPHAPGMVRVRNLARNSEHVVDLRERVCDCRGFQYREDCYHVRFMDMVADGDVCPKCGYKIHTPSCVRRSDSR